MGEIQIESGYEEWRANNIFTGQLGWKVYQDPPIKIYIIP